MSEPTADEIMAEAYPDVTQVERERETPQAITYQRRTGPPTVLAQRCLDSNQAAMRAKWNRIKYHGTHEKRKWTSKRIGGK